MQMRLLPLKRSRRQQDKPIEHSELISIKSLLPSPEVEEQPHVRPRKLPAVNAVSATVAATAPPQIDPVWLKKELNKAVKAVANDTVAALEKKVASLEAALEAERT